MKQSSPVDNKRPDTTLVVERLMDMMSVLPRAPEWMSTAEVHDRLKFMGYQVDRRTVVRDLNKLADRFGFERRGDAEAGEEGNKRKPLSYAWRWPTRSIGIGAPAMTEIEALTMTMVRDHLDALLPPMVTDALSAQFDRAEERLKKAPGIKGAGLKNWGRAVHIVPPTQPLQRPKVKRSVRDAIYQCLATHTRFTGWYQGRGAKEAKDMLFNPLGLVIRGEVTYLVATVWDYDDVRLYPLHRFERARKEDDARRELPGFSLEAFLTAQNGLGFATGRGDVALRLRFRNNVGLHLLETPLADNQAAEDLGNGILELTATVPETAQLTWWLLGFGDNVEVLAPAELRGKMREQAERMLAQYK